MGTHDPPAGGDSMLEQRLHNCLLVQTVQQADTVALPIASGPFGFDRQPEIGDISKKRVISVSHLPAAAHEFWEALQLLPTDCRLDIGHPIVIAEFRIGLEDYLVGPMTHGVW